MRTNRILRTTAAGGLAVGLLIVAYLSRGIWWPWSEHAKPTQSAASPTESTGPAEKIIVSDQAQKNLRLTAKSLKSETFWKTLAVPGMVVDRPGMSDREIVAPTIGTVSRLYHVPGETVQPGDVLLTLRLSSDALHETQADSMKATQDVKLAQAKLQRLLAAGEAVAKVRVTEAESEIKRLEIAAKSYREHLLQRGLSEGDVDRVADGELITEIPIVVPLRALSQTARNVASVSKSDPDPPEAPPLGLQLQVLNVELGQQVQAGQTLCLLSNHQALAIEGRAFRDETALLEGSVEQGWPVEVDFQEEAGIGWPSIEENFHIHHLANTIDPVTRTFAFLVPLENQSKTVEHKDGKQVLWRFRPGQKVRLSVRIEKLENVFVLSADAVVREGPEAFIFTQNVNTFERKGVHVLFQDRQHAVIANDGSLPTYRKNDETWTLSAIVQNAAAQLNRMTKAGTSGVPKGYHIHADGSLHKNEDESK